MQHNIEVLKSIYQSVANRFVVERDDAIAKINIIISSENPDLDDLADVFKDLTKAKLNIMGVQEETTNTINQYNAQIQSQQEEERKQAEYEVEAAAEVERQRIASERDPVAVEADTIQKVSVGEGGYGVTNSGGPGGPFPGASKPDSFQQ